MILRLTEIVRPWLPPFRSSIMSFCKSNESKHVVWVSANSFCAGVVSTTWPFFKIETALPGSLGSGISSIQYCRPKRMFNFNSCVVLCNLLPRGSFGRLFWKETCYSKNTPKDSPLNLKTELLVQFKNVHRKFFWMYFLVQMWLFNL